MPFKKAALVGLIALAAGGGSGAGLSLDVDAFMPAGRDQPGGREAFDQAVQQAVDGEAVVPRR